MSFRLPVEGEGFQCDADAPLRSQAKTRRNKESRHMRTIFVGIATAFLLAGSAQVVLSQANYATPEYMNLAKQLPNAKHTLAEAVMMMTKGTEVPIEAKLELDKGKLMLGVYTSAKGLGTAAESNSFKEYNGDATTATWMPATETFKDLEHIARSAQYHTLLTMTKLTIADMIKKAGTPGVTVVSVKEMVRNAKPVFEVVTFQGGMFKATYYDLVSGEVAA
jgi:hypothetical protein